MRVFRSLFDRGDGGNKSQVDYVELAPHGKILLLDLRAVKKGCKCVVSDELMKFAGRPQPFVAVLVDLDGVDYRFSDEDFAAVVGTIAAWNRGWVAPCAIVVQGAARESLESLLELTQLDQIKELRIVESREAGLSHITEHFSRVGA